MYLLVSPNIILSNQLTICQASPRNYCIDALYEEIPIRLLIVIVIGRRETNGINQKKIKSNLQFQLDTLQTVFGKAKVQNIE